MSLVWLRKMSQDRIWDLIFSEVIMRVSKEYIGTLVKMLGIVLGGIATFYAFYILYVLADIADHIQ